MDLGKLEERLDDAIERGEITESDAREEMRIAEIEDRDCQQWQGDYGVEDYESENGE